MGKDLIPKKSRERKIKKEDPFSQRMRGCEKLNR